ncbi:YciI family protein [Brenneria uluponensis]|uniref:YciI family protein n=1 Tax=Brenneria uluponensis TaxID=3057057 RepID=UPI0028E3EAFA|nr:YciI family protein [Brenneria ulupoensis]
MYIINLTYKTSLDQVEALLAEHISWLKQGYEQGFFIASGRKNPRVGGVILAKSMERAALDEFLRQDPFQAVANYDITDFQPSMTTEAFSALTHI